MTVPANLIANMAASKKPLKLRGISVSSEDADKTNHLVTLPSGAQAGDLFLVFIATDGGTADSIGTFPAGWITLETDDGVEPTVGWYCKKAVGGETSVNFTTTDPEQSAHVAYLIEGAKDPIVQAPDISVKATGSSSTPDATAVSVTGGPKEVFLVTAFGAGSGHTETLQPSGYGGTITRNTGGTFVVDVGISAAYRTATLSSENAGAWGTSIPTLWKAYTVAVQEA